MPVDVQIQPLLESVDLFGPPDKTSAYSLSGHISLAVNTSQTFFERPRSECHSLESLELVFEGQSELVSDASGYSGMRLCNIKRELVTGEPIRLSNEDAPQSGHTQPAKWEFIFDIPIPGWLPASSVFLGAHNGCQVGTQYTLYATARLRDCKEEASGILSSVICGMFTSSSTTRTAQCPITLKRFHISPTRLSDDDLNTFPFPVVPYQVKASVNRPPDNNDMESNQSIPRTVLAGMDVMAEIPEHISLNQTQIPLTLRVRAGKDFPHSALERTRVVGFNLDVRQQESYSSNPSPSFTRRFPVPPTSRQPPKEPLISPHPLREFYEVEFIGTNRESGILLELDFSLLPSRSPQSSYRVPNGGLMFRNKNTISFDMTLDLKEALPREGDVVPPIKKEGSHWKCIRTTCESPFLNVRHQVLVELIVQYQHETPNDDALPIAQEILRFSVPLHFVVASAPYSTFNTQSSTSLASSSSSQNESLQRNPYGKTALMKIPAYSQLFYPNGDPRYNEWENQGEPLPLYRKEESDQDIQ